jgi:Pterin-4a-carbinolamine dehydratase
MQREEAIVFRLKFKKYLDAVEFLRRVAEAAERLNHHPDVELPLRKPNPEAHHPRRRQQGHGEGPAAG